MKKYKNILYVIVVVMGSLGVYFYEDFSYALNNEPSYGVDEIPDADPLELFTYVNDNVPIFEDVDINKDYFLSFSPLDKFGRTGVALGKLDFDLMPLEDRESIGHIQPSGWETIKYDIVSGKYLYNRCHLIGFQLSGENDNPENLITCTRYTNVEGMLPFENTIASYIEDTNNSVMIRVTPIYEGDNLLASGIQMEALSVEDNGVGISFNVYIPNVQPGVSINYLDGSSSLQ